MSWEVPACVTRRSQTRKHGLYLSDSSFGSSAVSPRLLGLGLQDLACCTTAGHQRPVHCSPKCRRHPGEMSSLCPTFLMACKCVAGLVLPQRRWRETSQVVEPSSCRWLLVTWSGHMGSLKLMSESSDISFGQLSNPMLVIVVLAKLEGTQKSSALSDNRRAV